jgi:hypothetical protein
MNEKSDNSLKRTTIAELVAAPKAHRGERVVTLAEVDDVHGRPRGTAGRNFRQHRARFIEGRHYFEVRGDEIRRAGGRLHGSEASVYLTERGYLMLVKAFHDDLAWQVQEQLIDGYFRAREAMRDDDLAELLDPKTLALVTKLADRIATPIVGELVKIEGKVDRVTQKVASVETRLSTLEQAQVYRRKRIPDSVKRRHEDFARAMMPHCLPCGAPLFDDAGKFIGEHHHVEKASDASLQATMPVCASCNRRFNLSPMPRHFAETYHSKLRQWLGPLFGQMAKYEPPGPHISAIRAER